jgi:hypothetical protein
MLLLLAVGYQSRLAISECCRKIGPEHKKSIYVDVMQATSPAIERFQSPTMRIG